MEAISFKLFDEKIRCICYIAILILELINSVFEVIGSV